VLGAALCCYAALGAVLAILPRYVPDRLGGGPIAVGLASRTVGGGVPDRLGGRRTVVAFAGGEALGLLAFALVAAPAPAWRAAPALGRSVARGPRPRAARARARSRRRPGRRGRVVLRMVRRRRRPGRPAVGLVAARTSPAGALIAAAVAVAAAVVVAVAR
jgi:hypothetical protein